LRPQQNSYSYYNPGTSGSASLKKLQSQGTVLDYQRGPAEKPRQPSKPKRRPPMAMAQQAPPPFAREPITSLATSGAAPPPPPAPATMAYFGAATSTSTSFNSGQLLKGRTSFKLARVKGSAPPGSYLPQPSPSTPLLPSVKGGPSPASSFSSSSSSSSPSNKPVDVLDTLARLQSFEGCFSSDVLSTIKIKNDPSDFVELRAALGLPENVSDGVVYTLLTMAYLERKLLGVEREAWEGMYEKAREFVEEELVEAGVVGKDVDELKEVAGGLLL